MNAHYVILGSCLGVVFTSLVFFFMPHQHTQPKPHQALSDKIAHACGNLPLSDWEVDPIDPSIVKVTCYDPKTNNLKTTAVER